MFRTKIGLFLRQQIAAFKRILLLQLSKKSTENLVASDLLITNKLYASSVHCSYYSMFQHMTCKLIKGKNITLNQFSTNSKDDEDRASHKYLLDETISFLTRKANRLETLERNIKLGQFQILRRNINGLKTLRVESDYKDITILEEKSKKALKDSQKIITDLNTYFA